MNLSEDYLSDLMVRMAHHSTAIEGNSLTQGETKSVLVDGYIPRAMDMRELHEVLNYKTFMPFLTASLADARPLSVSFIQDVHRILCHEAIEGTPGAFKTIPNLVIGADFTPTPPYLVPTALHDWCLNTSTQLECASNIHDRIEAICRQHIAFERIHPFSDGNGRTGRALMVYACLLEELPPIVIPVNKKKEYIHYLNTADLPSFVAFAECLIQSEQERIYCF